MIFASDLDRTLIYSHRSFGEQLSNVQFRNIEFFNGRAISFMTEKTIALLHKLTKELMFIPVTTRSVEQYKRITLFRGEIRPTYAITCNGGLILKNGKVDTGWQDYIHHKIAHSRVSVEDVKLKIEETSHASWLKSIHLVDCFFIYMIIDPKLTPQKLLQSYSKWARKHGWFFSVQGRKVYFIPSFINKRDAVHYVVEQIGKKTLFAAGDSYLDVSMVEHATFGFIARHGEAAKEYSQIGITQRSGIFVAEEILETILSQLGF